MGISYIINNNDSLLTGQTIFGDLNITGGTITINGNPIGGGGFLYGTFTNCVGGNFSFNGISTITGNFENCVGGVNSFGAFDTVSGVFINCTGGQNSFGVGGALTGKLYRCQLTDGTFETPTGSGKIILGIDGNDDVINLTA